MISMPRLLLLAGVVLLAGCATASKYPPIDKSLPVVGSELVLSESLAVSSYRARSIVQNGAVRDKPDLYTPWCTFHVYRSRADLPNPTEIDAGKFIIKNAFRTIDYALARSGIKVAALQVQGYSSQQLKLFNDSSNNVTLSTVFELDSPTQPLVTKMICSIFMDPWSGHHPTLDEVQATLGGLAHINGATR